MVLVWSGPGGGGGARIAELAHELGLEGKPGSGAFQLPAASNPRGVALGLGRRGGRGRERPGADRAAPRLGRRGRRQRRRARARRAGEARRRPHDVPRARGRLGRSHPSRHGLARAGRDLHEPRGPGAAPAPRRPTALPRRAGVDLEARRPLRRRDSGPGRGRLRRARARSSSATSPSTTSGCTRRCRRVTPTWLPSPRRRPLRSRSPESGELRLQRYRPLFSGRRRRARAGARLPAAGARGRALRRGRREPRDRRRRRRRRRARTARPSSSARGSTGS